MQRNLLIALTAVSLVTYAGSRDAASAESTSPRSITPVPFVAPAIEGFSFPVDEKTIAGWTSDLNGAGGEQIALHAWGIWTGLTKITTQSWNGQDLRTYETWDTPSTLNCSTAPEDCPTTPRPLTSPGQLPDTPAALAVTVSYDPSTANYLVVNHLIDKDTLDGLQGKGTTIGRVVLPNTSIALKPTYVVLAQNQYALLNTWPGPPDPAQAYGPSDWPTCVWIDLGDATPSYGPFIPAKNTSGNVVCSGNQPASPENVVPLGAFIHFTLDEEEAKLARQAGLASATKGDVAVLVGMHVTSRESKKQLTRWTWQSFWWSTNADQPHPPSTQTMVSQRPDLLKKQNLQAANYAGCAAYQMLNPVQPKTGGESAGAPVFCYNPYLEAGFDKSTLPFTDGTKGWNYQGKHYAPQYGVQTTCMSCHLHAGWKGGPFAQGSSPGQCDTKGCYDAAVYVDMDAAYFQGAVTTDSLWSIPDSVP